MADALTFVLAMRDRLSGPASVATANVRRLQEQLALLAKTSAEIPNIKMPRLGGGLAGKVGGGGGGEKQQDAHVRARLANEKQLASAAAALDKQRAVGLMAQARAKERAEAVAIKAAESATAKQQKLLDRQMASRERHDEKMLKAVQRSAEQQKRAKERAEKAVMRSQQQERMKAFKFAQRADNEIRKAQKIAQRNQEKAAKQRTKQSIAEADKAHKFVNDLAGSLGMITHPATLAAAAVTALGAAFVFAAFQGGSLALAATEAKGDTLDMLEAMLGSAAAASETYDTVRSLTRDFAISLSGAQGLAQSLTAAGITNTGMLNDALKSVAQVDSVIKGSGAKVEMIFQKAAQTGKFAISTRQLVGTGVQLSAIYEELAKRTGKGVKQIEKELKAGKIEAADGIAALSKVIDTKFGALAGKQALDFSAQMVRLKDNLASLFDGVKTGPFLAAFKTLVDLFDEATPAGKALKAAVTGIFDKLFAVATAVIPYVKTLLKGLVIIALQVFIAFKPLAKALGMAFGGKAQDGPVTLARAMSNLGKLVGFAVGEFVKFLMVPGRLQELIFTIRLVANTVLFLGKVAFGLIAIWTAVQGAMAWLFDLPRKAGEAAGALINGLIKTLSDPERLNQAVKNLAMGALGVFKGVFGIASPSKVMAEMGVNMTTGLSKGLDQNQGAVASSMANVANLDAFRAAQGSAGGKAVSNSRSMQVTLAPGAITITGISDVEGLRAALPDILADTFEQMGLSSGEGEGVAA